MKAGLEKEKKKHVERDPVHSECSRWYFTSSWAWITQCQGKISRENKGRPDQIKSMKFQSSDWNPHTFNITLASVTIHVHLLHRCLTPGGCLAVANSNSQKVKVLWVFLKGSLCLPAPFHHNCSMRKSHVEISLKVLCLLHFDDIP